MDNKPYKTRNPIPVSVVTYRVKNAEKEELKRLLGRDLVDAERKGKSRG